MILLLCLCDYHSHKRIQLQAHTQRRVQLQAREQPTFNHKRPHNAQGGISLIANIIKLKGSIDIKAFGERGKMAILPSKITKSIGRRVRALSSKRPENPRSQTKRVMILLSLVIIIHMDVSSCMLTHRVVVQLQAREQPTFNCKCTRNAQAAIYSQH